jgi:hypothetical protein
MKRAAFGGALIGAVASMGLLAKAATPTTIVAVTCNVEELENDAEDFLAGALNERSVNTVDPSAIDIVYHERARLEAVRYVDSLSIDYSSIAWVTATYHAERLLMVAATLSASSLPYGEFTVYGVRARCSYRCFDVVSKRIVAAGSSLGTARSEDADGAQETALHLGLLSVARGAARRLS